MTTPSSLNSGGTPPPLTKPPAVTPPAAQQLLPALNGALNGQAIVENEHTVCLGLPFTNDDAINFAPILKTILTIILEDDPTARIKSVDPTMVDITKPSEVPKNDKIKNFVTDVQSDAEKKQFKAFFTIVTVLPFNRIKFNNHKIMKYLMENRFWFHQHSMTSRHVKSIGFIAGMHATYANRDEMKTLLDPYFPGIEYTLVPVTQFYIKDDEKYNVKVVELHVDAKFIDQARDNTAVAFMDPAFIQAATQGDTEALMDFIPNIKRGVMSVELYRATLEKHFEFCKNAIGVSINGLGSTDTTITQEGQVYTFIDSLATVQDSNGAAYFTSVEPTKTTDTEGRYILVTTKDKLTEAEKAFDKFASSLSNAGYMQVFAKPGQTIRRINYYKSKKMGTYAEGLAAKYKVPTQIAVPKKDAPSPRRSAWKRMPQLKYDSANFPEIQAKKTRTDDDASARTAATALTDERTEFDSRMGTMKESFTAQLNAIKEAGQKKEASNAQRISQAEHTFTTAKDQMIQEYGNLQTSIDGIRSDYANILERQNEATILYERRAAATYVQNNAISEIVLSLYNSMHSGVRPPALSAATISQLTPNPPDNDYMDTTEEHGTGAPGNAKRSSTDPKAGGRTE